jgi:hypothetical protein
MIGGSARPGLWGQAGLPSGVVVRNTLGEQEMNEGNQLMRDSDDGAFFAALWNEVSKGE